MIILKMTRMVTLTKKMQAKRMMSLSPNLRMLAYLKMRVKKLMM